MAELPRIKHASVWADGAKVGTVETGDYTYAGNDEDHVTDEGWLPSDGTPTTTLSLNTVTTVDGKGDVLVDAIEQKKNLRMQIALIDGRVHSVVMRCWEAKYNWDAKGGSLKGSFTFHGGAPKRT